MSDKPIKELSIDMRALLVREIGFLITATAEMEAQSTGNDFFAVEADLYRLLAVNCEERARMAEAFKRQAKEGFGD